MCRPKSRGILRSAIVALVVIVACNGRSAWGDEVALKTAVTTLLAEGWTADDLAVATKFFQEAEKLAPSDVRPLYAWTLVQMHAKKYTEAAASADQLVKVHGDDLPARRVQIWLKAYLKQPAPTLAAMSSLGEQLIKVDAARSPSAAETQAADFLGRMFGYLNLAVAANGSSTLKEKEAAVAEKLPSSLRESFTAGRKHADRRYAELLEPAVEKPGAGNKDSKSKDADDGKSVNPQEEVLKKKYLADEAENKKKFDELKAQFDKLAAQAAPINTNIQSLRQQIVQKTNEIKQLKPGQKNPKALADKTKFQDDLKTAENDWNKLNDEGKKVEGEAGKLQKQMVKIKAQYKADLARLRGERGPGDDDPTPTEKPTAATKEELLKAVGSYAPLNLEQEKQRVLESFAAEDKDKS